MKTCAASPGFTTVHATIAGLNPADESLIRRMTATIVHRGPDQQGCYQSPGIALGAVRLQVIDLDGGQQPMRSGAPSDTAPETFIVYNGEIYNFRELRTRTGIARPSDSAPICDTGSGVTRFHPVGHWLLCETARNVRHGDLVGARPAPGAGARSPGNQASLHPARWTGSGLRLGTQGSLRASRRHAQRLDMARASGNFLSRCFMCRRPRTLVEGVEKLPSAGHYLEWQRRSLSRRLLTGTCDSVSGFIDYRKGRAR